MYVSMKSLINKVKNIDREITTIDNRISDIDFTLSKVERNPVYNLYIKSLFYESSLLWEQKNTLIDQKNILLNAIKSRKTEEELITNLITEWMPEIYESVHTNVCGISVVIPIKHQLEKEETRMNEVDRVLRKQQIDSRICKLEKINDEWIANHGESNDGVMALINDLMDEREALG